MAAVSTTTNRTGGFLGGGQVGYNYQIYNRLVVGVETDAQWTGIVGQHEAISAENPAGSVVANEKFSLDWFGTTRLRAGLVRGDALSYFTAGVAYGGVSLNSNDYSGGYFANATTQTKAGWAVGTVRNMPLPQTCLLGLIIFIRAYQALVARFMVLQRPHQTHY